MCLNEKINNEGMRGSRIIWNEENVNRPFYIRFWMYTKYFEGVQLIFSHEQQRPRPNPAFQDDQSYRNNVEGWNKFYWNLIHRISIFFYLFTFPFLLIYSFD